MDERLEVTPMEFSPACYGDNCGHPDCWSFSVILPHRRINYMRFNESEAIEARNDWLTISKEALDFICKRKLS